ncbi:MAG: radical SAM protein, partial [Gammaproteobacteria bacterium]|nr:radical SAM protein [Gammaproteobacteria bacterium]NIR95514.1 radical SAM protein [Gammaproteobacteria bacterium]
LFGEYYLPCPAYPTNSLFKENPFTRHAVIKALEEFDQIGPRLLSLAEKISAPEDEAMKDFLNRAGRNSTDQLRQKADRLQRILKARISVLPPDCRHVDYDVIPLMVNDGCLYNCSFCEVKSGMDLSCRSRQQIRKQLQALKEFFGTDLLNYNSVYLGQHDALGADPDDILFAADQAYTILDIKKSYMQEPRLFLFGSAESF